LNEGRESNLLLLLTPAEITLPGIAPDDLRDADQREDRAVNRPMKVADHEPNAECQIEALENPDRSHANHRSADQAANNPHRNIK
jgi:hypothetical protein